MDAFFEAITDQAFYRPVITKLNATLYLDAAKSQEACGPGDGALPGSPVNIIASEGDMVQVALLDARWHWGWKPVADCKAVKTSAVWIEKNAIGSDYPAVARE